MTYDELYVLYQRAVADVVRLSRQNGEQAVEIERLTEAWVDGKMREDRDALLADNKRLRHDLARAVENHTRDLGEVERLRGLLREVQERRGSYERNWHSHARVFRGVRVRNVADDEESMTMTDRIEPAGNEARDIPTELRSVLCGCDETQHCIGCRAADAIERLRAQLNSERDFVLPPFGHSFTVPHDRMDEQFLAWLRQNCVIVTEAEYARLRADRDAQREALRVIADRECADEEECAGVAGRCLRQLYAALNKERRP